MRISIFHNILWSKYKGGVFSALHAVVSAAEHDIEFFQIAETENDRVGLADVDLSYHRYPYRLLYRGAYSEIPKWLLAKRLFLEVWQSKSEFVMLPGYHLLEYWAMLIAARMRSKTIGVFCDSTAYDHPHSLVKGIFKRIFFSQCDACFCYGQRAREYLMSYGVPNDRIYLRRQSAALPHDYDVTRVLTTRSKLDNQMLPRFLYVGRLSPEKNLNDLLYAFKYVRSNNSNTKLVLVGGGAQKQHLISLSDKLGLGNSVEFAGAKDIVGLRDEYLKASCLVLPSRSEPWGLVVNEALSYGCPVIVSHRCGCVPELVIEGKTGYTFECGNIEDLAEKMTRITQTLVNSKLTAKQCTDLISEFSPQVAAQQILDGCLAAMVKST